MSKISSMSRRTFLASGSAAAAGALVGRQSLALPPGLQADVKPTVIRAAMRSLEIDGRAATMMGLHQPNGVSGLSLRADGPFDVQLENQLAVPTAIHWHGLHPPNSQDGVPYLTQPVIAAGTSKGYNFKTRPGGTHWMHSHEGLQESFLLSAPLIVHDPGEEKADEKQIVLFLGDFSFTPPGEILERLRKPHMSMPSMPMAMAGAKPDANDVDYDAYLANDRTLADPEVIAVEKGARVRLRIINGSSGTNFFINLGQLRGDVIATDGMPVQPFRGSEFPLAIAQRLDIRLQLPREGAFPILAYREGGNEQTGVILATSGASVKKLPLRRGSPSGLLTMEMESQLIAARQPAVKAVDRSFDLRLGGDMAKYVWPINGTVVDLANPRATKPAVVVKEGQRAAIRFINETGMSHPMHLHGHSFQVVEINGRPLRGALRDTVLVPPKSTVTVAFDADNPGTWYVHCHVLWHLAVGMAALVQYEQ